MTSPDNKPDNPDRLRQRAEMKARQVAAGLEYTSALSPEETRQMIHELQVYQIELEMQAEELRKAQDQIGETLERYADLYDFAPVGFVASNREGLILEANLTFAGQIGIGRGRLINTPLWLHAAAPDRDKLQSHLDQVFEKSEGRTCELRLERQNGPDCYVQLDSVWVRNFDGVELCRTSVTDISIRKAAEDNLRRVHEELEKRVAERTFELSENEMKYRKLSQEFRTLLNAISDTLILLSPNMEILWTNGGNAYPLNGTLSDAVGHHCYRLVYGRATPCEACPATRCFNTAKNEVVVDTHNGKVLEKRAYPIKEEAGIGNVILVVSDITKKMTIQAEAMQAGHLASLGELASGVAHEINNPITGIINYGQILINECRPESMEKDIGQRIVKEGERISRIVKTLLSYARGGREEKRPARIPAILEESIILTQAQIRKEGIDLKIDLSDDLPEVIANFQQIQQSFINVINNARYALNEKYPERHHNKRLEIMGEKVTVNGLPYVRIIFYDQGVGIPAHEIPMLTKPFFSTKPFGQGTGLGLNITQGIITDHGGRLSFESTKGEFARVIIDLPAHRSIEGAADASKHSCN